MMELLEYVINSFLSWYIILLAFSALIYWYLTKTFNHWKSRNVCYIEPVILFGNLKDRVLFRQSFHEFQLFIYNQFKGNKIAGLYEGRKPTLICLDPNIIRHILVKDFNHFVDRPTLTFRDSPYIQRMLLNLKGDSWKATRYLMAPAFSSGKLKAMLGLVQEVSDQLIDHLHKSIDANGGQCTGDIQIKDFFGRFTMDVIASCAFGVHCDSFKEADSQFVKTISAFSDISLIQRMALLAVLLFFPKLSKFLKLSFFNMDSIEFLVQVIKDAKKYREDHPNLINNDFLDLMVAAKKAEENGEPQRNGFYFKEKSMDEETIIAQSVLFLLAGFETSSTLLTFLSYELALNTDVQEKLRDEILRVSKNHKGQLSYQALGEMVFLENVLLETLRKHPPIARIDRICTKKYLVPESDVVLEVGDSVSIPAIGLHYDSDFFPDPHKFNPDRFNAEEKLNRSPYAFLPFGAGPRNCIGIRFATMTTKLVLAQVLKDFRFNKCSKTAVPYSFSKTSFLLKPENGIWLSIDKV
uniref:Cytochrome P450 n=1 Tax=Clastoptera arizonana TaxID=38151 RepID=A0A1B6CG14_9HEMI